MIKLSVVIIAAAMSMVSFSVDAVSQRSITAKHQFIKAQACPATGKHKFPCKGYIVDHIDPLACGGKDAPSNMQWQTTAEGKAKDRIERRGCWGNAHHNK